MNEKPVRSAAAAGKMEKARKQAQANANYFNRPYKVYFDCAGHIRVERWGLSNVVADYIVYPQAPMTNEDFYPWQ